MALARGRTRARSWGGVAALALAPLAVVAASCAVDTSGVIRATGDESRANSEEAEELNTGECTELLTRLQDQASDLVGPTGFIGVNQSNQFDPFFRRGIFIEDAGFFGSQAGSIAVGESVVTVGDLLGLVRGGRLYLFSDDGTAAGSVWLDALPQQRFPTPETGLLAREGEIVSISPAVVLADEEGDSYSATVVQRIDISDPTEPKIIERLTVRGEVAGASGEGSDLRVAVSVPPPALDFLYASTSGGEDAATEHNRGLLSTTTLADWLGGYELTQTTPDGEESTTSGLLGGCDVVSTDLADSALGATVLIDLETDGGLADLAATTILGQGRVSFGADATYVLSPRSHAVGFAEPGQQGTPRVIISRIVDGEDGLEIDGLGIMPGALSPLPTPALSDGHVMVFTATFDQFGNGGYEARSLRNVEGEITEVDSISLPVQPWDSFTLHTVGEDLLLSGQQSSALIDVSDPTDLEATGIEARWEEGDFLGPPQLAPYGDGLVLSVDPGPVSQQFGSIDNFLQNIAFGEFGFGWEPWNDQQGSASIRVIDGHPIDGEVVATYESDVFALWPVASDSADGEVVAGVIGLRGDDGDLFDGALLLRRDGDQLVEVERWSIEPPEVADFGATECEKIDLDGNLMDILGLWNQTPLRCDEGVPGGMVGHICNAMTIPEISADDLRNWFGVDNPDLMTQLNDLSTAVENGASFQGCVPRQGGVPSIVQGFVDTGEASWLIGDAAVHRVDSGGISESFAIEPPYTT